MKKLIIMSMVFLMASICANSQNNSKRTVQQIKDSSKIHEGTFKGYATVYIVDFYNGTCERASDYTDVISGYPVYKKRGGGYYVRFKGSKYELRKIDPIPLSDSGYYSLNWKFNGRYYIEEIPTSW